MRLACTLGDQAVLGDGDQGRVQHGARGRAGPPAGDQQVEVVGERDLADQVLAQVRAAHHDGVLVGRADGGARHGGLAYLHGLQPLLF